MYKIALYYCLFICTILDDNNFSVFNTQLSINRCVFAGFHELNDEMNVVLKIPSVLLCHVFIMFVYCMTSTKHGSTHVNYCT